ncbi:MAG: hypothetical protein ACT4OU_04455 [Hyphomicrobium sp.]
MLGIALVAAIAVGAALYPRAEANAFAEIAPPSVVASGALAWAGARCGVDVRFAPSAPRLMSDDLLRISGEFESLMARDGRIVTCARALELSGQSAAPANSAGDAPNDGSGAAIAFSR